MDVGLCLASATLILNPKAFSREIKGFFIGDG
jgi:hypothetical protein